MGDELDELIIRADTEIEKNKQAIDHAAQMKANRIYRELSYEKKTGEPLL